MARVRVSPVAVALVTFLIVLVEINAEENSPFKWKSEKYYMPWLKGPNMCAVQEVSATRKQFYSECMLYKPRTICGNPTSMKYMCCNGYEKVNENEKGCTGVVPLENLYSTLGSMQLTEMRTLARQTGLNTSLIDGGTFTVFVPENKAFRALSAETKRKLLKPATGKRDSSLLLYHVSRGKKHSRQLRNNDRFNTLYGDNAALRINRYTNGVLTANCARVTRPNQESTNGMIHVIDRVLEPLNEKKTVFDELVYDQKNRFGELVTSLILTGVAVELQDDSKMFTVFAPTDAAFRNLAPELLDRIIRKKDNEALKTLLRYHIVPRRTICSAAILNQGELLTLEGSKLNMSCSGYDRILVNGVSISQSDMLASNGVIHAINAVLIPDSVRSIGEVAQKLGVNQFVNYARQAGLGAILDGSTNKTFTLFVPSDRAFLELKAGERRYLRNPRAMQQVIKYHILPGGVATSDMIDQQRKNSILGVSEFQTGSSSFGDKGDLVRLTVNKKCYGFNSAKITSADHVALRGMVHVIDKVIFPPRETLSGFIKSRPDLSEFYGLLQTGMFERLFEATDSKMTVFVPNNDAFNDIVDADLDDLRTNRKMLAKAIKYHLVDQNIYSKSISAGLRFRFRSKVGEWLNLTRDRDTDVIKVNNEALVREADILATNGVIHIIDTFLRK